MILDQRQQANVLKEKVWGSRKRIFHDNAVPNGGHGSLTLSEDPRRHADISGVIGLILVGGCF